MTPRPGFAALIALAICAGCSPTRTSPRTLQAPQPGWRALAPLPRPRFLGPQVAALGGKVYAAGGLVREGSRYYETGQMEIFDPHSGAWSDGAPMPTARGDMVLVAYRGRLLALGGTADGKPLAVVEEYDPRTDRWLRRADMPAPRLHHAAAVLGKAVYVVGGRGTGTAFARYDVARDRWMALPDLPAASENPYAVAAGEHLYVLGGAVGHGGEDYAQFQEYNPASGRWRALAPLPTARTDVALAAVGGKVVALGGWTPTGLTPAVEVYDPATDRWRPGPAIPRALSFAGAAPVGRNLYVVGGAEYQGEALVPIASLLTVRLD